MRFVWFPAVSHGHAALPGTLLSVATHAAFLGVVTLGHGPRFGPLDDDASDQQAIYYLPPPDRTPGQRPIEERITYVEMGSGDATSDLESPEGRQARAPVREPRPTKGGAAGPDAAMQIAVAPVTSDDSVYSVLAAMESAVRVEGSAAPVYPPDMLAQGIEGSVQTRFVIDTTGRADSASLVVLVVSNAAFESSVRAALPGMRFVAARVQGRKVQQMVEQEFQFRIAPPVTSPAIAADHTRAQPPE
jgi:TonB family protein